MLVPDLEHLEVLQEDNKFEGGSQALSIALLSASAYSDTGSISLSGMTDTTAFEENSYYGHLIGARASSSVTAYMRP